jgi:hypothetical protein
VQLEASIQLEAVGNEKRERFELRNRGRDGEEEGLQKCVDRIPFQSWGLNEGRKGHKVFPLNSGYNFLWK